eukprot:5196701-Prymnesium_polylepis.1
MEAFFATSMGVRPEINLSRFPPQLFCLTSLIEECWHPRSDARPPAQQVVTTLLGLVQQLKREEHGDLPVQSKPPSRATSADVPLIDQWRIDPRIGMTGVMLEI